MNGGCFSISSLGGIGGRYFHADHQSHPRSRSSASAAARLSRAGDGKAFQPRLILPLSLSWDHRVVRRRGGGALQRLLDPGARRLPAGVAVTVDVRVPDIGDFHDVDVIEILVKPGDTVAVEQSLITVESDKASMEIPSSQAGVVKELKVAVGDKVNEGTLILRLDPVEGAGAATKPAAGAPAAHCAGEVGCSARAGAGATPSSTPARAPAPKRGRRRHRCDLLVLGAGPRLFGGVSRADPASRSSSSSATRRSAARLNVGHSVGGDAAPPP
jgi:pyruvate/2-oxoglutarate dehydrogenase complex dihydrolipoamide acyltransferase (E2) component